MLKSIWSCAVCEHLEISHAEDYHVYKSIQSNALHILLVSWLLFTLYYMSITTKEGVTYRKIQAHLKPYRPQYKKSEDEQCLSQSSNMQTVNHKKCNTIDNQAQSYSWPKRDIKPPV